MSCATAAWNRPRSRCVSLSGRICPASRWTFRWNSPPTSRSTAAKSSSAACRERMNREFLDLFNRELELLKDQAADFAEEYPGIAGRLGGLIGERMDPMVLGLLEG